MCREQALPQECGTWLCHSTRSPSGSWDCGERWLCVCMLSRVARKWGKPHEGWKGERKDRELFFHECFIPQCIPSSGAFAHDASVVQHNLHRHGSVPCPGHSPGKKQPVNNLEAGTEVCAHQLPFLALSPRGSGLQRASSPALSPTPASAEPVLLSPCQHHPSAPPVSCSCCHQPCDISFWVLV